MLSGDQMERLSLARALYLETDFLLIDEMLSGLENPMGNDFFLPILCTYAIRYLPLANHINALEADGIVNKQDPFEKLVETGKDVQSLVVPYADDGFKTGGPTLVKETVAATVPVPLAAQIAATTAYLKAESRANGDARVYRHSYRSVGGWATLK
ncbi:ABC transporter FUM19 [Fusarium oxysporum f. sp. rapae]|uniref:ABC transporter FUM19 n=1 Tax=Fusarium oxysporum f. sp. rapae TaxID=485398 RepID=A0A8J5NKK4_FUSOX|nr:ABC transporter FUM19 [Fusarium oxysporum f. sp. rapae]